MRNMVNKIYSGTRTSASKSPAKKVGPKGPPCLRKPKSGLGEYNQHIEFEERSSCPFSGCDSIGHLSGKYEKHYILEACPRYHNMTPQQCKVEEHLVFISWFF